ELVAVGVEDLLRHASPEDPACLAVLPDLCQAEREDERSCLCEPLGVGRPLPLRLPFANLAVVEAVVAEGAVGLVTRRRPGAEIEHGERGVPAGGSPRRL